MELNFENYKNEIKSFCDNSGYSFDKLLGLSRGWSLNYIAFNYHDKNKSNGLGLLDETPLPLVLLVRKKGDKLEFEQTEHTTKYLGLNS
jgi:hypothetical protein